jgi:pimeloyl-ACP methyl ester carboxylesterase
MHRLLSIAVIASLTALLAGSAAARPEAEVPSSRLAPPAAALRIFAADRGENGAHACGPKGTGVSFRAADGLRLHGHRFGRGTTAVVFAHESGGSMCQWVPFARTLARRGYLTLPFYFRGYGKSQQPRRGAWSRLAADVIAAAKKSRSLGAKKVVVVGASMGGTAAVVAAANARTVIDGVVSVSAPSTYGRMNAELAAGKLQAPVLYLAGDEDASFADEARVLYEATSSTDKTLEILHSFNHGVLLAAEPAARSLIENFVAAR